MKTKAKPAAAAPAKKPPTIWPDGGITHPCGHESAFADGCKCADVFGCPTCGLRWRVVLTPPEPWQSLPNRTVVVDAQMDLPLPTT